jgi:hypothetical protein
MAKPRSVPDIRTDAKAEALVEDDVAGLDFRQFQPTAFVFKHNCAKGPVHVGGIAASSQRKSLISEKYT